jgi:hypothetical protein
MMTKFEKNSLNQKYRMRTKIHLIRIDDVQRNDQGKFRIPLFPSDFGPFQVAKWRANALDRANKAGLIGGTN